MALGALQLTAVDALATKRGELNVLAMLTQREEGRFYFEDLSGLVEVDLTDTVGCVAQARREVPLANRLARHAQ